MPYAFAGFFFPARRTRRLLLIVLALLGVLLPVQQAAACRPVRTPAYVTFTSASGKFQFVARVGSWLQGPPADSRPSAMYAGETPFSSTQYRRRAIEPIWTSDLNARYAGILVANDGVHLALSRDVASLDEAAVILYQRNRVLHRYSVRALVTTTKGITMPEDAKIDRSRPCYFRPPSITWIKSWRIDDARQVLTIVTHSEDKINIDLESGNIVRRTRTDNGWHWW